MKRTDSRATKRQVSSKSLAKGKESQKAKEFLIEINRRHTCENVEDKQQLAAISRTDQHRLYEGMAQRHDHI